MPRIGITGDDADFTRTSAAQFRLVLTDTWRLRLDGRAAVLRKAQWAIPSRVGTGLVGALIRRHFYRAMASCRIDISTSS